MKKITLITLLSMAIFCQNAWAQAPKYLEKTIQENPLVSTPDGLIWATNSIISEEIELEWEDLKEDSLVVSSKKKKKEVEVPDSVRIDYFTEKIVFEIKEFSSKDVLSFESYPIEKGNTTLRFHDVFSLYENNAFLESHPNCHDCSFLRISAEKTASLYENYEKKQRFVAFYH
jgi:hypothetical protein